MRGFSRGPAPPHICPENGEEVSYYTCASRCPKHGVHAEGDLPRCVHEYEKLKSEGFYARTQEEWLEHLHDADPEEWQRLVEEEKERERVREMIDADWFGGPRKIESNTEEQERETVKEDNSGNENEEEKKQTEDGGKGEDKDDDYDRDEDDEDEEEESDGWW